MTPGGESPEASYDPLADEYYNSVRHPTCANFRSASELLLEPRIQQWGNSRSGWCEVGCGDSILARAALAAGKSMPSVTLVDGSAKMLRHSRRWIEEGARSVIASAGKLTLGDAVFGLLVVSLGDAFNTQEFWDEARRIVSPKGTVLFTVPSYEWAVAFRGGDLTDASAEFEIADGRVVRVPSYIHDDDTQRGLISSAGLTLIERTQATIGDLGPVPLSPKLVLSRGRQASVVTVWVASRAY